MKRFVICATVALFAAYPTIPASAQEAPAEDGLRQELVRLNRSMEEIIVLLKQSMERQELDLLIQRVELATRKLTPLEQELRRVRNSLEGFEEQILTLEAMEEQFENQLATGDSPTPEEARAVEQQKDQMELHLKRLKDQSWKMEQRKIDLEGKIATVLEDVEALEDVLDERLGLR